MFCFIYYSIYFSLFFHETTPLARGIISCLLLTWWSPSANKTYTDICVLFNLVTLYEYSKVVICYTLTQSNDCYFISYYTCAPAFA